MSLDLSDATMMLQFGGAEEEEPVYPENDPEPEAEAPPAIDLGGLADLDAPTDEEVTAEVTNALADDAGDAPAPDPAAFAPATRSTVADMSNDDWDPFAEMEDSAGDAPADAVTDTPAPTDTDIADTPAEPETAKSDVLSDDWDPFADDEPAATPDPEPTDDSAVSTALDDWDPFAEDDTPAADTAPKPESEPTPEPKAEPEPEKPQKGKPQVADLDSLSADSALFDQLGGSFGDMDD